VWHLACKASLELFQTCFTCEMLYSINNELKFHLFFSGVFHSICHNRSVGLWSKKVFWFCCSKVVHLNSRNELTSIGSTSRQKKFNFVNVNHLRLLNDSGPLVKIIILLSASSVSWRNTLKLNIPWADVNRVFQRPLACMSDLVNQIYTRTKSFLYLRLPTEQTFNKPYNFKFKYMFSPKPQQKYLQK